jgi:uncharacterized phiE125 gp8 family phage protein
MLSLTIVKEHLRVDHADDDSILTRYLSAGKLYAEGKITGPIDSAASRVKYFDSLGEMALEPRLVSVESITYLDDDGAEQTLAASVYQVITSTMVGKVILAYDQSWPSHRAQSDSVTVTYTAGFATVPVDLEQAILMYVGHLYANAESTAPIELTNVPQAVDALLSPYVNYRL